MGQLVTKIEGLGYHFLQGKSIRSVPQGDGFREIFALSVRAPDGQEIAIKCDDSPTLFPIVKSQEGYAFADSPVDGVRTTCGEVYRDYYDLDDEGYTQFLYNYSCKTRAYLDAERRRIGLMDYKEGLPEPFFALETYDVGQGLGKMDVGCYADGRFVAQTVESPEESYCVRMHFFHFPTQQDLEDAAVIRKMESDFKLGRHREVFHCNDCGEFKHWVDIPGTIQEKKALRLARRCGCRVAAD